MGKQKILNFRVHDEQREALKALAKTNGVTLSELVRSKALELLKTS